MTFCLKRHKELQTEEYEMEIVTPMFLGGAEEVNRRIRSASLKGMLRFWWRAVYGPSFPSISEMKAEEDKIFGSTEYKSKVDIHVLSSNDLRTGKGLPQHNIPGGRTEVFRYLRFGASNDNNYLKPGSKFKLRVRCSSEKYLDQVKLSLHCMCNFGGLGSKSRNGFGCIDCPELSIEFKPSSNAPQEYTAFSKKSMLFKDKEQDSWEKALGRIGQFYVEARKSIKPTEDRKYIAKPLPQKGITNERYAKPYFLHVNKLESGKFQGQVLFLPSDRGQKNREAKEYEKVLNSVNEYFAKKMREATL